MTTAIVIGATGLVGSEILALLEEDPRFDSVVTLVRRARPEGNHPKVEEHVIDFRAPESWRELVRGDVLFSAMGTTKKKAGSQEAQYEVDYTFQMRGARAAYEGGVDCVVLVSSMGADPSSSIFYSRMKGELDRDVCALGLPRARVLRPGILDGDRQEHRPLEAIGLRAMRAFAVVPGLRGFRPIHAKVVARAAIAAWEDPTPGPVVYEVGRLFELGSPPP